MKDEIYIHGEPVECTKEDLKVLEKYFKIDEKYKEFETNDLDDVYYIKARKILSTEKEKKEFCLTILTKGLDLNYNRPVSPCKIIGVKKGNEIKIDTLFSDKDYTKGFELYSYDDVVFNSTSEMINNFDWIIDIEWRYNSRRTEVNNSIIKHIVDLIRCLDIPYTSTSRRKVKVLKK